MKIKYSTPKINVFTFRPCVNACLNASVTVNNETLNDLDNGDDIW